MRVPPPGRDSMRSSPPTAATRSPRLVRPAPLGTAAGSNPMPSSLMRTSTRPGAPAILTARGIVVLYNAGNSETYGDPDLPHRVYTGGQALFDVRNPLNALSINLEVLSERTNTLFPFWAVVTANTLAALCMGLYLWVQHPDFRRSIRETPLGDAPR